MEIVAWAVKNQQPLSFASFVLGTTILSGLVLPHLTAKCILIMGTGALLSIGFHFGRKITTAYDVMAAKWDKDLAAEIGNELGV